MQRADGARSGLADLSGSALRGQGLRVLAGLLLAAGLLVLAFRMELSYFRLHLYLLGPVLVLALVPPRPLQDAPRKLRRTGYWMVPVMILVVAAFSTVWDNYVASWGVWAISEQFTTGVRIMGVQIEQILIYSYTTTLVAQAFVAYLRGTEVLLLKSGNS